MTYTHLLCSYNQKENGKKIVKTRYELELKDEKIAE